MSRTQHSSYSAQPPCFVLFLSRKTGWMAAQIRRRMRPVLGVSISIFKAQYVQHQETISWTPPTHNSSRKDLLFFVIKTKRKLVNPPTHIIIAVTPRGGIIQPS